MFEEDCNDCGVNQYDYSKLNTRYEVVIERNEIIEWNKDSDNAQYRDLERIVDLLNFKEMNLENCRKSISGLHEENQTLKRENNNRRAVLVDELRGLFQMYLTQCRSISEEAIITLIRNDVKKRVFEVFDDDRETI